MTDLTSDVVATLDQIMHAFIIEDDDLDSIGVNLDQVVMDLRRL
jgi:hypothetical protein